VLHEEFFAIRSAINVAAPERETKETWIAIACYPSVVETEKEIQQEDIRISMMMKD
jgi:hypothetical protein